MKSLKQSNLLAGLKNLAFAAVVFLGVASAEAEEMQFYNGQLGGCPVELVMVWEGTGEIYGQMNYRGALIALQGINPRAGVIRFIDCEGDVYFLTKRITDDCIIWSGVMNDSVPVVFTRSR